MIQWRRHAGAGITAALLASLLATSLVATTFALTITNLDPTVNVPAGVATNVGIGYTWSGTAPGDTLTTGTTIAVALPAGYSWTVLPTLAPSAGITLGGPVASNGNRTETWSVGAFPATGAWALSLSGGQVLTSSTSGTSTVTLSVGGAAGVGLATLNAIGLTAGTVVPVTVSPTSVPANGTSTILVTFGTVTCTSQASFTVTTSAGTFTTTTLPGVTSPVNGTSVTVSCANFSLVAGKTLALRAPTTPGTGFITVTVTPTTGSPAVDSNTRVTFTNANAGGGNEREKGHGARKVAFFAGTSAGQCASAGAMPTKGAHSFGFAIVNTTGKNRLNVTVSLKGATANATYSVYVDQSGTCSTPFTIHTNRRGDGNGHVHLALASGTTQVWVTAISGNSVLVTRTAALTVKSHADPLKDGKDHGRG
jgi:hypothetical protein